MKNKFHVGNLVMYVDVRKTNIAPLFGDILLITEALVQIDLAGDTIMLYRALHNNRELVIPETKMKLCE